MASYNPPTEDLPTFNSALFNQPEETLSQAEADLLYLSKTKTDTSTAPQTTFNNQVYCPGGLSVGVQGVAGGLFQSNRRFRVNDANGNATGYLDITYGVGAEAVYTSQSIGSLGQTFHRFWNCVSGNATPVLRLEIGDTTKIPGGLEVGTNGVGGISSKAGINLTNITSPYDTYCQLYPTNNFMNYIMEAGTTTASFHSFYVRNNANLQRLALKIGHDDITIIEGANLNARLIKSTTPASASHTLFDNMIAGGTLTIGNSASTNTINGVTTFNQNINAKADIVCFDKNSPFTNNLTINHTTSSANYTSFAGPITNSFHNFTAYNNAGLSNVAFQVGYTQVNIPDGIILSTRQITSSSNTSAAHTLFTNMVSPAVLTIGGPTSTNAIRGDTTFNQNAICNNRLNWGSTAYSFPFASSQSLGYYLKATGTGTALTSGVTKSILTTSTIPIGVWRIDWSVQNVVGAAGAGTITQAQSYVSTTLDGNNTTAVPFTGSIVRSHIAEVYGNNDIQLITSSFTYQQSTAGVLYLNAFRVFSTGTYSFTGELSITRIA